MIRIAVMFPNESGKRFDLDYYRDVHLRLVHEKYQPFGLREVELDVALSTTGNQAAPYLAIGYMYFDAIEQFFDAFKSTGKELMQDIANFTDIEAVVQISQHQKSTDLAWSNQTSC